MIINNRFIIEVNADDIRVVKIVSIYKLHNTINDCFKLGYNIYSIKSLERLSKEELKNYFKDNKNSNNFKKLT